MPRYCNSCNLHGYAISGTTNAWVNEVRLWSRALSLSEIRQTMGVPLVGDEQGPVLYWPLQDRFGTIAVDRTGTNNGTLLNGATFVQVDKGAFIHELLVDGQVVDSQEVTETIWHSDASVRIRADAGSDYLQGTVDDLRLWKVGRPAWAIAANSAGQVSPDAEGLVSAWNFDTGSENLAYDSKSDNTAVITSDAGRLTDDDLASMWTPTWFKAGWTLHVKRHRGALRQIPADQRCLPAARRHRSRDDGTPLSLGCTAGRGSPVPGRRIPPTVQSTAYRQQSLRRHTRRHSGPEPAPHGGAASRQSLPPPHRPRARPRRLLAGW